MSTDFFDSVGDNDFTNWPQEKDKRGNLDYFFPKGWKRYGLNVKNKNYDHGNMDWLSMNNGPKEWAVAYHGTEFKSLVNIGVKGFDIKYCSRHMYEHDDNINPASKG